MKFIHISRPFGSYYSLPLHFTKLSSFIAIHLAGDANRLIPACAICFSLSSASPAHSPKEEYVITQCTDTPKEEAADDQEDRGEPQGDKSEPTEKKSLAGWLAAQGREPVHQIPCYDMEYSLESCPPPSPLCLPSFQRRCLSADCVPPLGMTGRRRRSPGRSSWMPTRSSWRRRCTRPGGWCSACR